MIYRVVPKMMAWLRELAPRIVESSCNLADVFLSNSVGQNKDIKIMYPKDPSSRPKISQVITDRVVEFG